ncbi:MAG: Uma2 family endonuclease [Roseiflexaceae bacterium]|nr:Uma2 family endonuclease [Roseiflexaceae bacterium]
MTIAGLAQLTLRSIGAGWSYARWEQLPEDGNRYEIIDGVLYVTTAPSNFHQWIISRLFRHVGNVLEDRGWGYAFTAPIGLLMPGCDPVQPDFVLISRANAHIIANRRIRGVPDLIAEVVSPGSVEQDARTKRAAYARAGVPEYWIIRPDSRDVLVCSQPDVRLEEYTHSDLVTNTQDLTSATLSLVVPVHSLFSGAPDETL